MHRPAETPKAPWQFEAHKASENPSPWPWLTFPRSEAGRAAEEGESREKKTGGEGKKKAKRRTEKEQDVCIVARLDHI